MYREILVLRLPIGLKSDLNREVVLIWMWFLGKALLFV